MYVAEKCVKGTLRTVMKAMCGVQLMDGEIYIYRCQASIKW